MKGEKGCWITAELEEIKDKLEEIEAIFDQFLEENKEIETKMSRKALERQNGRFYSGRI